MKNWIRKKSVISFLLIAFLTVCINVLAWGSRSFCDFYIANIFPIWVNTYGRFTGIFPFSVGEFMLMAGCVFVAGLLPAAVLSIWKAARRVCRKYFIFCTWTALIVSVIMTLNCFILYHASTFSEKYIGALPSSEEFTFEELI